MNRIYALSCALAFAACGTPALASQAEQHSAHHPEGPAPAAQAPGSRADTPSAAPADAKAGGNMAAMDAQLDAMHAMHAKMLAAKTPAERKALMAEHDKLMRDGLSMMSGMSANEANGMNCDMGERHRQMVKHMAMMQAMMEMMSDRLPAPTSK